MRRLALAALLVVVAGCSDGRVTPPPPPPLSALQVVNGSDRPVAVLVDGRPVVASLAPATATPRIPWGDGVVVQVELRPTDGTAPIRRAVTVAAGTHATLVAARLDAARALQLDVPPDSGAVPAPGTSKLRVLHYAANAPALDVWRTQPDFATPIRLLFPFPHGAASAYVQSAPGDWSVIVTPATPPALGEPDPRTRALASATTRVAANVARTVVLLDAPNGGVKVVPLE